jgi:hypothetical protein
MKENHFQWGKYHVWAKTRKEALTKLRRHLNIDKK